MGKSLSEYSLADDAFGYLMHLLYCNNVFSELHLPSLNFIKRTKKEVIIIKKIPSKFSHRVNELKSLLTKTRSTNLHFREEKTNGEIRLKLYSIRGHCISTKNMSFEEKQKIIELFFSYHKQINNSSIKITNTYESFFNKAKLVKDISLLKKKINPKNKFDKKVLKYLDLISSIKIDSRVYSNFKRQNLHGDFIPRNIIRVKNKFTVIDLDMLHKGYSEIQFIRLLKELFGFATKDFFTELKNKFKPSPQLFKLYLYHKILDISLLKATYFTNKEKYSQLKDYVSSQIDFITDLINNQKKYKQLFSQTIS